MIYKKNLSYSQRVPDAAVCHITRYGCHAIHVTLKIGVWRISEKPCQHKKPLTEDVHHASQGRARDMQMIFCRMWIYLSLAVCVARSGGTPAAKRDVRRYSRDKGIRCHKPPAPKGLADALDREGRVEYIYLHIVEQRVKFTLSSSVWIGEVFACLGVADISMSNLYWLYLLYVCENAKHKVDISFRVEYWNSN